MNAKKKKELLDAARALAEERASRWWVFYKRGTKSGRALVAANSEAAALKQVKGAYQADPSLPTRTWDAIKAEVGLA